ncbi:MAG: DUF4333 domain-containing protein [Solirubrobacteraceae bacterium]
MHSSAANAVLKRLAPIASCVTLLSACGGTAHHEIDPAGTANYIDNVVFQQTGFRATDVRCPTGIPATAGGRFNCHFTGPEGPYTAYLRIVSVHGRRVDYRLKTQPSSWPAPKLP